MSGSGSTLATFGRRLSKVVATILLLALVYIGFIAFPIVVGILDTVGPLTSSSQSTQVPPEERAQARQEGRVPEFPVSFNNSNVMLYLVPLAGIWLLGSLGRRRGRLPVSVFGTFVGLWLAMWLSWHIGEALFGLYESLSADGMMSRRLRGRSWAFALMFALLVPILSFRWLRRGPGWLDRIMRGEVGPSAPGSPAEATGAVVKRARLWLYAGSIVFTPILWVIFDWFDGTAAPGPFALTVRGLFVVWALWLISRDQIPLAWPDRNQAKKQAGTEPLREHDDPARIPETVVEMSGRRPSGFGKRKPSDIPL